MRNIAAALTTLCLTAGLVSLCQSAEARKWTITERSRAEQSRIDTGERSGELTFKEAAGLRSDMSDILNRIDKDKDRNGGKLSYKDEGKIEKDLNKMSVKIQKLELAKRVTSR